MSARRWLDSVTSVIVWRNIHSDDERWTVVFYGKYYTFYTDLVGEKKHLCMVIDKDCQHYRWEEYNTNDALLGQKVPWGQVPAAIQELVQRDYRKDIPHYNGRSLAECPGKFEHNRRNYGGGGRRRNN